MNDATVKYSDPINDLCFKKIFSDEARMMGFLNTLLRRNEEDRIVEILFIPVEQIPDLGLGKRSAFDLKCKDQAGNVFIVEMQKKTNKHFLNRAKYCACQTYMSQVEKEVLHAGLIPVILIAMCQHSVFPEEVPCISMHRRKDEKTNHGHLLSPSYIFMKLAKFNKSAEELETVEDDWLYFLSKTQEIKDPPAHTQDKHILSVYQAVERFNFTPEEYDVYIRSRLAEEADMIALDEGYEEGFQKGIGMAKPCGVLRANKENHALCEAIF